MQLIQFLYLLAGNIEDKIAIEVGPGPGGITRAILDTKIRECHVIEKDPRFLPSLNLIKNAVGPEKLHISIGDCLHYNITSKSDFCCLGYEQLCEASYKQYFFLLLSSPKMPTVC